MQVEHQVGVAGQAEQGPAQPLQGRGGLHGQHMYLHGRPHQGDIGRSVRPQYPAHGVEHGIGEVGIVAVEVLGAVEFEPAHRLVVHPLGQPDGIGHRNQHHLADQAAVLLGVLQQRAQVVGHQHTRQFLGMQTGLHVGLGPGAGDAKVETAHRGLATQALAWKRVVDASHGDGGLSVCVAPDAPGNAARPA